MRGSLVCRSGKRAGKPWGRGAAACGVLLAAALLPPAAPGLAAPNPDAWEPPPPLDWPAANPIVESEEVGYLPGGGAVSTAGDYTYALPITVPDGRAGMEPRVVLHYSSRGGSGLLGRGWSLDYGGSEITRCSRTTAIDGRTEGVSYGPDGALCLDGQRMVQVAGPPHMAEGAEYRTERDTFAKLVAHGDSGLGPDGFEVFAKGGTIRVYRPIEAKRVTEPDVAANAEVTPPVGPPETVRPVWVLREERDRDGNVVLYDYDVESEDVAPYAFEYRIRSIAYTGWKNGAGDLIEKPRREVRFEYEPAANRPDKLFQYENGVRRRASRRLGWIGLYAPTPTETSYVGAYTILYDPTAQGDLANPRSLLAGVARLDAQGHRLWRRDFEWDRTSALDFDVFDDVAVFSSASITDRLLLLDVDNDGKDEMAYAGRLYRTSPGSLAPFDGLVQGAPVYGRPADVDGDGKMEVLRLVNGQKAFYKWNSATETFEPTGDVFPDKPLDFVDGDGDGRIDAFQVGPRQNPNVDSYDEEWYFRRNTGAGFADPLPVLPLAMPYRAGARTPSALDLNGDGRGELHVDETPDDSSPLPRECPPQPNHAWHFYALEYKNGALHRNALHAERCPGQHTLADINGDGLKDLLEIGPASSTVRYNTGAGFLPEEPLGLHFASSVGHQRPQAIDIDGDGREDLISSQEVDPADGTPLLDTTLHLSRGDGFETFNLGVAPYNVPAYDPYPPGDVPPEGARNHSPVIQTGDVNGDGLVDLVVLERDVAAKQTTIRVLLQKWHPRDVIARVRDEGAPEPRESVFYSAFPTDSPSPSTCTYPSRCVRHGMTTAREHWIHRQDEPAAIRRTAYDFDDLRTDLRGRGSLGFGKVRTIDLDSHAETITFFDHATVDDRGRYPFASVPRDTWQITPILQTSTEPSGGVVWPPGDKPITARVRHTHTEYAVKSTNGDRTYFVVPASSQASDWEQHVTLEENGLFLLNDGSETAHRIRVSTPSYDDFGNETASAAWTVTGQRCESTATFDNLTSDWHIGLRRTIASACHKDGLALPEKRLTTTDYDTLGHVVQVTVEPDHPELSRVTTFARNIYGQVWKVTAQAAGEPTRKTYLAYDPEEHISPRAVCNALNHCARQLVHPAYGVPILAEDENGVRVFSTYDGFGRLRSVSPDDGMSSEVSYQESPDTGWGLVTVETSEDGGESLAVSDDWGRTVRAAHLGFDGEWIHERVDYNLFGQASKRYRPSAGQAPSVATITTHDTLGRALSVQEPNTAVTTMVHGMFETVTTDPAKRKSRITRDVDDRLAQTANLYEGTWVGTSYSYGPNNQVEDIIDPENNVIHAEYDKLGRRVLLDDPDRGTTTWSYNGFDEVTSELDALGDTTVFERDVLGRVLYTAHDGAGVTLFAYDGQNQPGERGRLTYTQSPDGVEVRYGHDALGRNNATEWQIDGRSYTVRRSWDALGRLEGLQYPEIPNHGQLRLKYDYNPLGYESAVRDFTDPAHPKLLWQVDGRNAEGRLTASQAGNGIAEARQYDPLTGRLTDVEAVQSGEALFAVHYDHDLTGNVWKRDDHGQGFPRTETFQYDDLDRLARWVLRANDHKEITEVGYDLLGNVETVTTSAGTETHHHDGQLLDGAVRLPHALTARSSGAQSTSFFYDARGRQIAGAGREITWKPFDLPSTIHQDGRTTTFSYDAFGTRVRKVRFEGDEEIDGADMIGGLYERRWSHDGPTQHVLTVNGADGPVAQMVYTEAANDPGRTLYVHRETLGSVGLVTDNDGGEVERTYFDPFGAKVDAYGAAMSPELGDVKLGFTGHRHDDELGLIDMRGRVYDPAQKRFLSPDPHVPEPLFGQSYNRYAYVVNNPLRFTDPTGFRAAYPEHMDVSFLGEDFETGPDGVPMYKKTLVAPEVLIVGKSDEAGHVLREAPPDFELPTQCGPGTPDDTTKDFAYYARMAWGGAKQLGLSLPPVVVGRQLYHNYLVVRGAVSHAADGDWDLAGSAILEMPQQNAETAASMITGPVEAALAIPDTIDTAINATDPERRGAAAVVAAQEIATVAMTVAAVAGSARSSSKPATVETAEIPPKEGQAGGKGAGQAFPNSVKERARAESGGRCVFCGKQTTNQPGPARSEIDHAIPKSKGGNNTIDNAQNTCRTCNRQKSDSTSLEFRDRK